MRDGFITHTPTSASGGIDTTTIIGYDNMTQTTQTQTRDLSTPYTDVRDMIWRLKALKLTINVA